MKIDGVAKTLDIRDLQLSLEMVDKQLLKSLSDADSTIAVPAMRVASNGGKQLRSILVLASARACSKDFDDSVRTACVAVELLHLASLIHDDIIDESARRRDTATINAKEGVSQAILVGDYLIAKSFETVSSLGSRATVALAKAFKSMSEGQSLELKDEFNLNRSLDSYEQSIKGKTAALMAAACELGGLCSDAADTDSLLSLSKYGEHFGMAFQLTDDLFDVTGGSVGKPSHNDIKQGIYTMPIILLQPDQHTIKLSPSQLQKKLLDQGAIEATLDQIKHHSQKANEAALDENMRSFNEQYWANVLKAKYPVF